MRRVARILLLLFVSLAGLTLSSCVGQPERLFPWEESPDEPEVPIHADTLARSTLILDFTATWCINCPKMASAIGLLSAADSNVVSIAVHYLDEMQTDASMKLVSEYSVSALPLAVVDFDPACRTSVSSVEALRAFRDTLAARDPAVCTISAVTAVEGGTISVEAEVSFLGDGDFAVGVALTRDGIVAAQTGATDDYVHDGVLQAFMQEGWPGDSLGRKSAGETIRKKYFWSMGEGVDPSKMNAVVYVLRQRSDNVWAVNSVRKFSL